MKFEKNEVKEEKKNKSTLKLSKHAALRDNFFYTICSVEHFKRNFEKEIAPALYTGDLYNYKSQHFFSVCLRWIFV